MAGNSLERVTGTLGPAEASGTSSASLKLESVSVPLLPETNVIIGQSHFIKTVEDIYEAISGVGGGIKFGLAFSEASGPCLVRYDGSSEELAKHAANFLATQLRCGHTFAIFIRSPHFPVNILNKVKEVAEVCQVFAATANALKIVVAEDSEGCRGVLGVIDGEPPKGIEDEAAKKERRDFLRMINYKR